MILKIASKWVFKNLSILNINRKELLRYIDYNIYIYIYKIYIYIYDMKVYVILSYVIPFIWFQKLHQNKNFHLFEDFERIISKLNLNTSDITFCDFYLLIYLKVELYK